MGRLGLGGLLDGLAVVLAQAVEGASTLDGHAGLRDVADLDGAVLAGFDGDGDVLADLVGVHVEGGDEFDVADVVVTEADMHEAGHGGVVRGVLVVLEALDERGGTVAQAHDGELDVGRGVLGHGSGP